MDRQSNQNVSACLGRPRFSTESSLSQQPVHPGQTGTTGHPNGGQTLSFPPCGGQEEKEMKNEGIMIPSTT